VSVVLAAGTLWLVHRLLARRTGDPRSAGLLVAVLGLTPAFVIAATTSMDYLYGLFLFVAGWTLHESRRPRWLGALLLGLAAVARLAYAPLGLVLLLVGPGRARPARERAAAVALTAAVAVVGYVPAWRFEGDLSFLTAERPSGQGVAGLLGRAVL
jgi:4-amino-4-deoxy-L-arabinose transferase-like glycosyltransferase